MADFKYVIQTELQLSPSSVNKLLEEVASTDRRIKEKVSAINVGLKLNSNDKRVVQEQIGNMKATLPVGLKLDRSSLSVFKREIDAVIANAKRELTVALNVKQQSTPAPARTVPSPASNNNGAVNANGLRRLGAPGQQSSGSVGSVDPRVVNAQSRAMNAETNRLMYALREQVAEANRKLKEAKNATEQERLLAQALRRQREEINLQMAQDRASKRLQAPTTGSSARAQSTYTSSPVDILRNPDASYASKERALKSLKDEASNTAKVLGEKLYRSWEVVTRSADGSIEKTRTATFEFNEMGRVVDRANRTMSDLGNIMGKNMLFYMGINAAFNAITNSVQSAVSQMVAFESAYRRIENIEASRNNDERLAKINGTTTAYKTGQSKKDIFNIGQRYGLNPTDDVMPIYTDIMKRKDIAQNANQAKLLTQLVVRAGIATGGNNVQGSDLQSLGQDFTSIYSQMYNKWTNNKSLSGDVAIRKMSNFVDSLAEMSSEGVDIDKSMDAIADLVPYVTGDGKLDLNFLSAIVGKSQESMGDASGAQISAVLKTMFSNLTKTGSGNIGSDEARRILGTTSDMSLESQLGMLALRMGANVSEYDPELQKEAERRGIGKLSEGELGEFTRQLASSGGNGGVRQAEFKKIIEALPGAYELWQETLNSQGKAEELALDYSKTLRAEWQKLVAQLQELAVNVGDSGILDGFKTMIVSINTLVSGVNTLVQAFGKLGGATKAVFGEEVGGTINGVFSNALLYGSLFAGGKAVHNKWFKKGANGGTGSGVGTSPLGIAGDVASTALLAFPWGKNDPTNPANRRKLPANVRGNFGTMYGNGSVRILSAYSPIQDPPNGRYYRGYNPYSRLNSSIPIINGATRINNPQPVPSPSRFSRVGSTVGNALNAAWLFSTFRRGPGSIAGGSSVSIVEKIGGAFGKLLPLLGKFASLIARLSIWGAAIGGVALGVKYLYNSYQKKQDKKAEGFMSMYEDQTTADATNARIKRAQELIQKGMPSGLDEYGQAQYRFDRQRDLLNYSSFGKIDGITDEGKYKESQEFNEIISYLKSNGMELQNHGAGVFEYKYQDSVAGKRKNGALELFPNEGDDEYGLDKYMEITDALVAGTGSLSIEWEKANENAVNYANSLANITAIQERLTKITQVQSITSALNATRFSGGGENSASYFEAELGNTSDAMSRLSQDYSKLKAENELIAKNATDNALRSMKAQNTLMGFDSGKESIQSITEAFNAAKEAGSVNEFTGTYDVTGGTEEDKAKYNYAKALADNYNSEQAQEQSKKSIEDITNAISQQVASLKELQVAYMVASSGANAFEGALKKVQSNVAQDIHEINMADNYEAKKTAMSESFTSMAQEAKLYQAQATQIQQSIDAIKSQNSDQDFSMNALYNPSSAGLSAEQASVKQLNEMLYDTQASQNASLEALKQQIDAMKELVLSSDKYKDMWDSVNERIELSKTLASQLKDIGTSSKIAPDMANMKSLFTPGFNKNQYLKEQADSSRDSYIEVTEQIKKSLVSYGGDATKLKEALAEIKGTYTDKVKAVFLDPLKDIINTDLQDASDKQMEAANAMQDSMALLQQILDQNLQALSSVVASINTESETTSTSDTTASTTSTSSNLAANLALNMGPISQETADRVNGNISFDPLGMLKKFKPTSSSTSSMDIADVSSALLGFASPAAVAGLNAAKTAQNSTVIGNGGSDASWNTLANKNLKLQTTVTADELNAYIDKQLAKNSSAGSSILKGTGQSFVDAAKASGLDPVFLLSLAAKESGWGRGNIAKEKNAVYSIGANDTDPSGNAYKYNSVHEGIVEGAKWIARNYTEKGQDTIQKMRDNGGVHEYNSHDEWVKGVSQIMAGFGKNAVSGNESIATGTAASNPLSKMLTEMDTLSSSGKFVYKQINGKFQGSYQDFVQQALSDCSMFVQEMFDQFLGINLPRTAAEQYNDKRGKNVAKGDLQAGDLVFFNTTGKTASHVGIYTDNGKFMQMGNSGLKESDMNSSYWKDKYDGARRFPGVDASNITDNLIGSQQEQALADAQKAFDDMIAQAKASIKGAFLSEFKSLTSQKNIIKYGYNETMQDYVSKMPINGQGKFDYKNFQMDTLKDARLNIADAIKANNDFIKNAPKYLQQLAKDANDKSKSSADRQVASAQYQTLKNILNDGTYIAELKRNTRHLEILAERYADMAYKDPNKNAAEAFKLIQGELQNLENMDAAGKGGGVAYYEKMQQINEMDSTYMTRKKQTEIRQTLFDNHGYNYKDLLKSKEMQYADEVKLLVKQMTAVAGQLDKLKQGTNTWYLALEDAVALQDKVIELENKKTELSKKYFEQTSKGVYAYINARAYTQSRDYVLSKDNRKAAISKYQTSKGSLDANEQLVNLQIISESHDKMIQVMNDYRSAVVGAFKAGAISLKEYMERLHNLRDMQDEIKTQAVNMTEEMQGTFSSSLADALKSGMQGSFDAPGEFIQSIKDGLASSVSNQMSNIVLQQSGLQDVMNGLITSIVGSLTTGDANKSINAFNTTDFKKKIDEALSPFLPLIQQITASTDGIFGVLKDQLFNAPTGFKIDDYLYEIERAKTAEDLGKWGYAPGTDVNEAGSPNYNGGNKGEIVLPPMSSIPTGVPDFVTKPIEDVLAPAGGGGSLSTPFQTGVKWNPVKEALQAIIDLKTSYSGSVGKNTDGKARSHAEANAVREALALVPGTEDIVAALGNGIDPETLGIDGIQKLLQDTKLNQFDMTKYLDGIDTGVTGMSDTLAAKIEGVIGGVGSVVAAINAKNAAASGSSGGSSSSSGSSSGYYGGGSSSSGGSSGSSGSSSGSYTPPKTAEDYQREYDQREGSKLTEEQKKVVDSNRDKLNDFQNSVDWNNVWKNQKPIFHTGGIGGAMNFARGDKLSSNEFTAILQNDETIFQKGQLGSFLNHFLEGGASRTASTNSGGSNVNVQVAVSGAGADEAAYEEAISRAVTTAVQEVQRQNRLTNLRNKGVVGY